TGIGVGHGSVEREQVPDLEQLVVVPEPGFILAPGAALDQGLLGLGPATLLLVDVLLAELIQWRGLSVETDAALLHAPAVPVQAGPVHAHKEPRIGLLLA